MNAPDSPREIDPSSDEDGLSPFEATRLTLSRLAFTDSAGLARALECTAAMSASALHIERVGVWMFDDERRFLRCIALYELGKNAHCVGPVLDMSKYPRYLAALEERRSIVANDVLGDPRTNELADYLEPLGIVSMLDVPIFRRGAVAGIICHEHSGERREWSVREQDFAISMADILATMFEQADRISAEEALRNANAENADAQRMQALGRLAANVAHDFNALLQIVSLQTARIKRGASPVESAQEIEAVCEQGRRLAGQLLAFAKEGPFVRERIDLSSLISEMEPLLSSLLHSPWSLDVALPGETEGALYVTIERSQLEQVVMNLVSNARDAMPAGGHTSIAVRREEGFGVLEVSDRGLGMDAELQRRVFEPFFTTKPPGKGTGLGLSIVYGIVERVGGTIDIQSSRGQGSLFRVRLPLEPDDRGSLPDQGRSEGGYSPVASR
ncbi:MAG: ATP-binding protein [Polyangiaceae bacterium]